MYEWKAGWKKELWQKIRVCAQSIMKQSPFNSVGDSS